MFSNFIMNVNYVYWYGRPSVQGSEELPKKGSSQTLTSSLVEQPVRDHSRESSSDESMVT